VSLPALEKAKDGAPWLPFLEERSKPMKGPATRPPQNASTIPRIAWRSRWVNHNSFTPKVKTRRFLVKKLILAVTVLALCSLSFAEPQSATSANNQQDAKAASAKKGAGALPDSPFATTACSFNFTSGANNTFLQYCVSVNGNIVQLQTPSGHFQIGSSSDGEGYGVCDVTGGNTSYNDYGTSATSNWNPATLVSQTGTSVKIARSTSDGIWTLTQTITQVSASSSIKVVMALKNNTAVARNAYALRYADVDADGRPTNNLDGTHNTAIAWTSTNTVAGYGLMLQNVGTSTLTYDGFAQNTAPGPVPCHYGVNFVPGVLINRDGSLVLVYVGAVPANGTKTFNMMYKGL